jgi:hypothetical protein
MFCERTKEEAAQATAGEFQKETRKGEATVRTQQTEQMFTWTKGTKMERCPDYVRVHVQQDFLLFCYRSGSETYVNCST